MDQLTEEQRQQRLHALQLADLGTARRDYISTVDAPSKYRKISMDQIEAARESNKKGSAVNRLAEANKAQLSAWNSAWKSIEADTQLEDLDTIMDGQSHRAHLADTIKESGGQKYAKSVTPMASKPLAAGGGGKIRKPKHKGSFCKSPLGKSPPRDRNLDPAKECNNRGGSPSLGISRKPKEAGAFGGRRPQRPPTMKTRRAVPPPPAGASYDSMLVDSSTFMNAVSNVFPSKSSTANIAVSEQPVNNDVNRARPPKTSPNADVVMNQETVQPQERTALALNTGIAASTEQVVTPPKPMTKVEAFSTPPEEAAAGPDGITKTRIGFCSSLPQPTFLFTSPAPESKGHEQSLLDAASEPKTKAPASSAASKNLVSAPSAAGGRSASSATIEKHQPEQQNDTTGMMAELDKLTKLLDNVSLLPDDAASYLKSRKGELESKLLGTQPVFKPEVSRVPVQTSVAEATKKEELKRFQAVPSTAEKPVESKKGRPVSTHDSRPAEQKVNVPSVQHQKPADASGSTSGVPKSQHERTLAERTAVSQGQVKAARTDMFSPRDFATFDTAGAPTETSRSRRGSDNRNENTEPRSSTSRTPNPGRRGTRVGNRQRPAAKEYDILGSSTDSSDDADNIIGEYLLPGRGYTKPTKPLWEAARQRSDAGKNETPTSTTQGPPAASVKPHDVPSFPINATTMQYYKGPVPLQMTQTSLSTSKAYETSSTNTARPSAKAETTAARECKTPTQAPSKGVSFELPAQSKKEMPKHMPKSAAAMQYFKGAESSSPSTSSSNAATPYAKPAAKSTGIKGAVTQGKQQSRNHQPTHAAGEKPSFPVNPITMQYAKAWFPDKDKSLEDDGLESSGQQQQHRTALSPDVSPFKPNDARKENSKPAPAPEPTSYQERKEKKNASIQRVQGLEASKWAH